MPLLYGEGERAGRRRNPVGWAADHQHDNPEAAPQPVSHPDHYQSPPRLLPVVATTQVDGQPIIGLSLETELGLMGGRQLSPHGEIPCALPLQLT
jgi:hypothetical protein